MRFKILICLLLTLLSASCSDYDYLVKQTRNNQEKNFYTALAIGYREIAKWERDQYDWSDADYFSHKGVRALAREDVEPDDPRLRDIDNGKYLSELLYMRKKLINTLDNEAKIDFPLQAAHLQILYDSLVEQSEENWQEIQINRLRDEFEHKLKQLQEEKRLNKRLQNKPVKSKNFYTIYFDDNSAKIDYMAEKQVNKIIYYLQSLKEYKLILEGHTDYLGTEDKEVSLSQARINSIKELLLKADIPADKFLREENVGSKERKLISKNNSSDRVNRRVEIYIILGLN